MKTTILCLSILVLGCDITDQAAPDRPASAQDEMVRHSLRAANRRYSDNSIRQIFLAIEAIERSDPTASAAWENSRGQQAGLSWRVAVLPMLGKRLIYDKFKLSEPWDSPANSQLIARMPDIFSDPGGEPRANGKTRYRLLSWRQSGKSPHIVLAEVATASIWTKPDEVPPHQIPLAYLGPIPADGITVALDDHIVRLSPSITQATFDKLLAGEPLDDQDGGPDSGWGGSS